MRKQCFSKALFFMLAILLFMPVAGITQNEIPDAVLDIFDAGCAIDGCHLGPVAKKGLDLSEEMAFGKLVNAKSHDASSFVLVKPGDSQNSYLIKKIMGSAGIKGKRMPRRGAALTADQIKTIADWIDSMPAGLQQEMPKQEYAGAFPGWTTANIPTAETLPRGAFMYRIAHRFNNPVDSGFDELFGLDGGATSMTQVAFPIGNDFTVSAERSRINATFEFGAKWRFLREKTGGSVPVSAALMAGVDWATEGDLPDPENANKKLSRTAGERFAIFAQVPISKAVGNNLSLLAVPGILLNGNVTKTDETALVTLGLAGKLNFNEKYALFAEYVPILAGASDAAVVGGVLQENERGNAVFYDSFTAGFEIHAGGHVFHVFVSNSGGNTTNEYMSGGNFDFFGGDMRLGFNIYRLLNYPF
jgi:hypothetical protein